MSTSVFICRHSRWFLSPLLQPGLWTRPQHLPKWSQTWSPQVVRRRDRAQDKPLDLDFGVLNTAAQGSEKMGSNPLAPLALWLAHGYAEAKRT